jgi:hypothetical protein
VAEPSLALTYDDLRAEVGIYLGFGGVADDWTEEQRAAIESCVSSGLRRFYYPSPIDGQTDYSWSFLRPMAEFLLREGTNVVPMPPDFGQPIGPLFIMAPSGGAFEPVKLEGEGVLKNQYSIAGTATGPPAHATVRPIKGTTSSSGQRHELYVWPTADKDYTLALPYYVNPEHLNTAFPYHMGGPQHAETVLESCLAVAEERKDDQVNGPHKIAFKERMAASIAADRRLKAQYFGYNSDLSDLRAVGGRRRIQWPGPVVTYGGQRP